MKKVTKRSSTKKSVKTVRRASSPKVDQWTLTSEKTFWGKDQPMILVLSAGIVVCIVAGLYLSGWL